MVKRLLSDNNNEIGDNKRLKLSKYIFAFALFLLILTGIYSKNCGPSYLSLYLLAYSFSYFGFALAAYLASYDNHNGDTTTFKLAEDKITVNFKIRYLLLRDGLPALITPLLIVSALLLIGDARKFLIFPIPFYLLSIIPSFYVGYRADPDLIKSFFTR